MMKRNLLLLVLAVTAVLLVACGGSETPTPAPVTLTFKGLDEFKYDPSTASVAAGSQVTVNFENVGVLEHSWILVADSADPATVSEADALAGATTGNVPAGQSKTLTFTAPAAGTYKFVCAVAGHAVGGMVGTLTVTP